MIIHEVIGFFLAAFISLFTIINPFSTASVFHTISPGISKKDRKFMAKRATFTAATILILFALLGTYILNLFSITIPAFQIAGGILIFGVGYRMIRSGRIHFSDAKEEKHAIVKEDVSIIPLAIPMMSGPGAMTVAIVLMGDAGTNFYSIFSIILAIILVCYFTYFLLLRSHALDKLLGKTGLRVADKILGLIVIVIGVQFILNGLSTVIPIWLS